MNKSTLNFYSACQNGNLKLVKRLLRQKKYIFFGNVVININGKNGKGDTPLHVAIINKRKDIAAFLIEKGAFIDFRNNDEETTLHSAIKSNISSEIVELLLNQGSDVTAKNKEGKTPIDYAGISNVELLFKYGAKANKQKSNELLFEATVRNHIDLFKILIKQGADINATYSFTGQKPLHIAISNRYMELAELLIKHGADINANYSYSGTPLHMAVSLGNIELVELLIKHKADINARNSAGETPLYMAVEKCNTNLVDILLKQNANVNVINSYHVPLLHKAIIPNNMKIFSMLIEHNADINIRGDRNETPLHDAAERGNRELAELLIKYGADINARNSSQETSLHIAVSKGNLEIADLLIKYGADINARNSSQETPLHIAVSKGNLETAEILIKRGTDIKAKGELLKLAYFSNNIGLAKLLLLHGAEFLTTLQQSLKNGRLDWLRLILEHGENVKTVIFQQGSTLLYNAFEDYKVGSEIMKKDYMGLAELLLIYGATIDALSLCRLVENNGSTKNIDNFLKVRGETLKSDLALLLKVDDGKIRLNTAKILIHTGDLRAIEPLLRYSLLFNDDIQPNFSSSSTELEEIVNKYLLIFNKCYHYDCDCRITKHINNSDYVYIYSVKNAETAIDELIKIQNSLSSNLLHLLLRVKDKEVTFFFTTCAFPAEEGVLSFAFIREKAKEELRMRGNPPYKITAFLDIDEWKK